MPSRRETRVRHATRFLVRLREIEDLFQQGGDHARCALEEFTATGLKSRLAKPGANRIHRTRRGRSCVVDMQLQVVHVRPVIRFSICAGTPRSESVG